MSVPVLITLTNTGPSITGPFSIYCMQGSTQTQPPLITGVTKDELLAGYYIVAPTGCTGLRVFSDGVECTNYIDFIITTTTSTTSTTTTSTSTTSTSTTTTSTTTTTTTCAPQEFVIQLNNITSVSNIEITSTEAFSIFWDSSNPASKVDYAAGTYTNISKTFSPAFTGTAKIQSCNLGSIEKFVIPNSVAPSATNTIVIQQSQLVKLTGITEFRVYNNVFVSGITTSNLNPTLIKAVIWVSDISGSIINLPPLLEQFDVRTTTAAAPGLTGNISTMYATRPNLTYFWVTALNALTGDISSIPSNAAAFAVTENNTIAGNFSSLSDNADLDYFICNGSNTITGSINDVNWTSIVWFEVGGSGIKTGNINTISFNPTMFAFSFPNKVIGINSGITGSLSNLPDSLIFMNFTDATLTGATTDIPTSATTFTLGNNGTVTGAVTGLPVGLQQLVLTGNSHTISGTINSLPANLRFVKIEGDGHNVSGYTGPRNWGTLNFAISGQRTMCKFSIFGAAMTSLSSTQADNLIIDLAATSDWRNSTSFITPGDTKAVNYKGAAVASPAGIAAQAALEGPPRLVPVTNY